MTIKVKASLGELQAYKPGKPIEEVQQELGLETITKLASNENPFGCSAQVKVAATKALNETALYPDGYAAELRSELAAFYAVKPHQLVIGAGLDEVIQIVSRTLLVAGDNIVQATPTFSQYALHANIEGVTVKEVPVNEAGEHDLDAMLAAVDANTKILWLCNPNNPTGTYFNAMALDRLLTAVPAEVLVILDEAYAEYVVADDFPDSMPLIERFDNVMVMRTFSKAYGIAALRIGFAACSAAVCAKLNIVRLPFNTSRVAQAAAVAALADQKFIADCQTANRAGLAQWVNYLEAKGFAYYPSQANFIFFKIGQATAPVFDALLAKGFIVRAGLRPEWLRVTIGSESENAGCIAALEAVL
ncbi:histidinol-phosphate aminotransferase [Brochothrix campestris FSL F6-1037]|uniref:Histidinol-phosphate aminotransferase n=1 Tax=Brochothrix campestris FSL F6-1037 TaxID=1265861 RepID=W7CCE0_9LIST|nr:histidinol-phosphate transaminase [Brochothrix campestris]EUJ37009.1 histidinol-phosphate aminotransferase [Brochothrix campestris FSL F6-1037]